MRFNILFGSIVVLLGLLTACGGGGGSTQSSPSTPAPTITISVNPTTVTAGQSATLSWSSTNTTSCTASGAWSGSESTGGSQSVTPSGAGTDTYTLACNGPGGMATNSALLTVNVALAISSLSSSSPTALTPLYISTIGLNVTQPFVVALSTTTGAFLSLPPIRTQNDGTVVVATPLYMNPATGQTSSLANVSLTISQGSQTSSPVVLNIQDIPQNSDYGTSLGQISRAFYNFEQISLGLMQDGFQAIQATPSNSVNTAAIQSHIATQLKNAILARSDVDRIITTNSLQIGTGTLADGTSISFNSSSVEMMDRVIGMYLSALQPEISSSLSPGGSQKHPKRRSQVEAAGLNKRLTIHPNGTIASILPKLGVIGGVETIISAIRTDWKSDSTLVDRLVASEAGAYAGLGIYGALFAGLAGPEIVAAATVAGLVIGVAAIGNDIYKLATDPNPVLLNTNSAANESVLTAALNALSSPQATLLLDSAGEALGGLAFKGGVQSLGQEVADFLQQDGTQLGLQGAALFDSTIQLFANFAPGDQVTAQTATAQFPTTFSSQSQGFGTVTGMTNISNSQGPILSGLTGISINDPTSGIQFSDLADPNGNYDVIVSLGNSTINYSNLNIDAFDPITSDNQGSLFVLSAATLNLSGLTSISPFTGPTLTGSCTDTDAGDPDSDDPDCD